MLLTVKNMLDKGVFRPTRQQSEFWALNRIPVLTLLRNFSAAQIMICKQELIACISIVDPHDVPVGLAGMYYAEVWIESACCVHGCHRP